MKKLTNLLLLFVCLSLLPILAYSQANTGGPTTLDHNKQVIGYLTQWDAWKTTTAGVPSQGALNHLNVDFSKYTIINFSFFGVAVDGSLHSGDYRNKEIYKDGTVQQPAPLLFEDIYSSWDQYLVHGDGAGAPGLLDLAHQNGVKVMASIGGWSMCRHFPEMAADPVKKANFIADCQTLISMGFDGIDLDWEYPGPFSGMNFTGTVADFENFAILIEDIRAAIGPDKLITAAMSAAPHKLDGFDWPRLANTMDYFNMMTYDFNGGWSNIAGHNSPLYSYTGAEADWSWDRTLSKLDSLGVPHNKINMGMAFYGRGVVCDGTAALNAPTVKRDELIQPDGPIFTCADYTNWPKDVYDGTPNYFFVEQQKAGWTEHWDDEARVPYLTKGQYFLSYDNVQSIAEKAEYINTKQLAGTIVWTVFGDLQLGGTETKVGEHKRLVTYDNINSPLINKANEVFANGGIPGNIKPTVTLTAPLTGESFTENVAFTISADANDADGSIAKVEFYDNNALIGEDATAPYSIQYTTAVIGNHSIKARAIDNLGDMTVSASAAIIVELVGGGTCTAPQYVQGTTYPEGFEVKNNAIKYRCKVSGWCSANNDFYVPGIGLYWQDAWTEDGFCGNQAPQVSVTSPADGEGFVIGTPITVTANATDADGSIAQVEFFADVTSLGIDSISPYSITWTDGALGTYSVTAVATDDRDFTATSEPVSVTISETGNGGCTAPQYVAGTAYEAGTEVKNNDTKYVCDVGGWCSSSSAWAYEPGVGTYWTSAWTEVGPCGGADPVLTSIEVTPPNASIEVGASQQYTAQALDQNGNPMAATITWSASTGSITSSGLYTGSVIVNNATITATSGTVSGTALVTVSEVVVPVLTTIVVSPANASITEGSTQQFAAQGYDQNGNAMSTTVNWAATAGSINSSGLYTGSVVVTNATVSATSGTVSGTAIISVNPVSPCIHPPWSCNNIYTSQIVEHNGHAWQARWWTQCEEPGTTGEWGVWIDLGVCAGLKNSENSIPESMVQELKVYPNPFNTEMKFSFNLKEEGNLNIRVYNTLGAEVKSVERKSLNAGSHEIIIESEGLPAGFYNYTIDVNGNQTSGNLIKR